MKNLSPIERFVIMLIIIENASYHSRLKVKVPTMANNKKEIITFIHDNLPVPSPIPIKSDLIQMIKKV